MGYKVLVLYKRSQTHVNTIYEHLLGLKESKKRGELKFNYLCIDSIKDPQIFNSFDCIIVHFSIRICFYEITLKVEDFLRSFKGTKVLFIQDDYDNTMVAKEKIKSIKFDIVFTSVPDKSINEIYPRNEFLSTKFENVLTSYCKDKSLDDFNKLKKANKRKILIGYRGRELQLRYGKLGQQKKELAIVFRKYCKLKKINSDIKFKEKERIYGNKWNTFLSNSRAILGSESGSNIFDWDGDLESKIAKIIPSKNQSRIQAINQFLNSIEKPYLMNQISSRIFEAINCRSALILIEGNYSKIIKPWIHFIPIKEDYSNLDQIHKFIKDTDFIDELTLRAFKDISLSRKFNYDQLHDKVGNLIINSINEKKYITEKINLKNSEIKKIKVKPSRPIIFQNTNIFKLLKFIIKFISFFLNLLPKEKALNVKKLLLSFIRAFNII